MNNKKLGVIFLCIIGVLAVFKVIIQGISLYKDSELIKINQTN